MSARPETLVIAVVLSLLARQRQPRRPLPARPLDIYFIDTEGGQATLYVSPAGQTLLVDTGNAGVARPGSHPGGARRWPA